MERDAAGVKDAPKGFKEARVLSMLQAKRVALRGRMIFNCSRMAGCADGRDCFEHVTWRVGRCAEAREKQ
ncbi:hypothetical protein KI387_042911, partial [Taxus chinensis]